MHPCDLPWISVPLGLPDPILGLSEAYNADTYSGKINVGVGAYRNNDSQPVVLNSVKRAERNFLFEAYPYKEYAPVGGLPEFCMLSKELIYSKELPLEKVLYCCFLIVK